MKCSVYDGEGVGLYSSLYPSLPFTLNAQQEKEKEKENTTHSFFWLQVSQLEVAGCSYCY